MKSPYFYPKACPLPEVHENFDFPYAAIGIDHVVPAF